MASVLLATSVVGISGSLAASYQSETFAQQRRAASAAARKAMESVTALPLDPAVAGQPALSDFQPQQQGGSSSTTTTSGSLLGSVVAILGLNLFGGPITTTTTPGETPPNTPVTPAEPTLTTPNINVARRASLTGAESATGDFATVTVTVPLTDDRLVRVRRLVTSVEAESNQSQ